jgi:hypothetical protein
LFFQSREQSSLQQSIGFQKVIEKVYAFLVVSKKQSIEQIQAGGKLAEAVIGEKG